MTIPHRHAAVAAALSARQRLSEIVLLVRQTMPLLKRSIPLLWWLLLCRFVANGMGGLAAVGMTCRAVRQDTEGLVHSPKRARTLPARSTTVSSTTENGRSRKVWPLFCGFWTDGRHLQMPTKTVLSNTVHTRSCSEQNEYKIQSDGPL